MIAVLFGVLAAAIAVQIVIVLLLVFGRFLVRNRELSRKLTGALDRSNGGVRPNPLQVRMTVGGARDLAGLRRENRLGDMDWSLGRKRQRNGQRQSAGDCENSESHHLLGFLL